jgi:hypothetical protein
VSGNIPANFLRHYSDVYSLLDIDAVQKFIGTEKYEERKKQRFRSGDELCVAKNPAFLFKDKEKYKILEKEYLSTASLYYAGQIPLANIVDKIKQYIDRL